MFNAGIKNKRSSTYRIIRYLLSVNCIIVIYSIICITIYLIGIENLTIHFIIIIIFGFIIDINKHKLSENTKSYVIYISLILTLFSLIFLIMLNLRQASIE